MHDSKSGQIVHHVGLLRPLVRRELTPALTKHLLIHFEDKSTYRDQLEKFSIVLETKALL